MMAGSNNAQFSPRGLAALAVGVLAGVGCSLALDLDDKIACTDDSDCVYSNGPGHCAAGFCAAGEGGTSDGGTASTDPTSAGPTSGDPSTTGASMDTTQGVVTGDDTTGGPTTTGGECIVNTDCAEDERCLDDACVSLLSPDCQILRYPAGVDRDTVVYFGSIMPTEGLFETLVVPLQNATQLAFDDFNQVTTLQGGRQVAWVGCDSTEGASEAVAAADHLVHTVGVPAIIGPIFSESVIAIAQQVTVDTGTFVISPTASAESISSLQDDNLVWRVTPSDAYQINGFIDRFTLDIVPAPARVLVLYKDDAYGNGLVNGIQTELVQGLPGVTVHFASYANPATFADTAALLASYGQVIGDSLAQAGVAQSPGNYDSPDDHYTDVIILGTSEMEALVTSYVGVWAQLYSSFAPMPRFTMSHGGVPSMEGVVENLGITPGTEPLAALRPVLYANMQGISPNVFDVDNFTAFNIRYKIAFMNEDAITSASLSYDATLAALFAAVTIPGAEPVTGAAIAAGMAALNDSSGTAVSFSGAGLNFILTARNALASGNTVDLQGVSGALNWDPATGELRADLIGWGLSNTPDAPVLQAQRAYLLNPDPATDGMWVDLL
jgi:branched-chain amino acid transport system substrate-binding protein